MQVGSTGARRLLPPRSLIRTLQGYLVSQLKFALMLFFWNIYIYTGITVPVGDAQGLRWPYYFHKHLLSRLASNTKAKTPKDKAHEIIPK